LTTDKREYLLLLCYRTKRNAIDQQICAKFILHENNNIQQDVTY